MAASVEFETTVIATGNNTGIVAPPDAIERLGQGDRAADDGTRGAGPVGRSATLDGCE